MGRKRSRSASSSSTSTDSRPSEAYRSKRSRRSRSTGRDRRRESSLTPREAPQSLHRRHDSPRPRGRERSRSPSGYRNARTTHREDSRDRRGGSSRRERSPDARHHRHIQRDQPNVDGGPPQLLSIHRAKVQSIRPFGIFVALRGYRRHGMVHCSQVSDELSLSREDEDDSKVKAMEFFCPHGSEVWVKVTEVREEGGGAFKVACSMKAVDQENGKDMDPSNTQAGGPRGSGGPPGGFSGPVSDYPPELGSIQRASIRSIKPYGVFVQMEGFRSNALVHLSQVADGMEIGKEDSDEEKVAALSAVVSVGETLFVKVVEIKEDDGSGRGPKIGASIKLASQRDGVDLDPQGTKFQPRGEGGPPGQGGRRPVGSQVGQATGGKVEWGHLAAGDAALNAALHQDGRQYDMIGDEVEGLVAAPAEGGAAAPMGRGRDAVKPAWMTDHNTAAAPGSEQPHISSIEEAMAILAASKSSKHGKKHRKDKKHKKGKKEKNHKHSKHKHKSFCGQQAPPH
ncbi:hypothetical protein ABBQ38_001624 [Trebouxia sp. C0009 RCD-2024]